MAQTQIVATPAPGQYPSALTVLPLTAADVANGNYFISTGRELLLAFNSDTASHNVTVTSQADQFGRLGSITTQAVAAGAYAIVGPLAKTGWANSSGWVLFSADNATVKFAVIQMPF